MTLQKIVQRSGLSLGGWVICLLAAVSSVLVFLRVEEPGSDLEMWVFARPHHAHYEPVVDAWNDERDESVALRLLSLPALERRMMAGFLAGVPSADLIEADVRVATRAFTGPIEDVGFVDLTDRLRDQGILEQINAPSFTPWTSRGRIFGLPHDVHPVMLCYRSDLAEKAGIDVEQIETWDDFITAFAPLMEDRNGDGRPDRFLLNLWDTQIDTIECLVLQAGGAYFDRDEKVVIDSDINARTMTKLATWLVGPGRIAIDAQEFTAYGNRVKLEGLVVASLMPDWLAGVWKNDMPQLSEKVKLMPLPAFEPGGCRTSVWGGTMLGIAKTSQEPDAAWELAQRLYLSEDLARRLFETNGIISPIKRLWSDPMYDRTDAYFCGQAPGRMYVDLAADVPMRTSSPFNQRAKERVRDALTAITRYVEETGIHDEERLIVETRKQLEAAADAVRGMIARNVFIAGDAR